MPDIPGNSSTSSTIAVGGSVTGNLEVNGDHDWFAIQLVAGQKITVTVNGITLEDSYLRLRDGGDNVLAENDDISLGVVTDSRLVFTAPYTGTFYLDVGAFAEQYSGTYQLNVEAYAPPPVASTAVIAQHLTSGYWGGDSHHFNVSQGGTITVNLSALTSAGQNLAREALTLWSDIIGISFSEVSFGGQITFDDNEDGAFSTAEYGGGITTEAHVNVSTQWLTNNGTTIGTYSFQTYIHEIGHALGLGHGGYYNGDGNYATDAIFTNDGWPVSIMSYFDQSENSYFSELGFTRANLVTPMIADIRAMGTLYGLSTTTRTGDTTYGFANTSGRAVYSAAVGTTITALTIFDSGGIDTINYSGFSSNQVLNLNSEVFSNVGGGVGNVVIAFGTVIENALGGSGADRLVGNGVNNSLNGGTGIDVLTGGGGADTFIGLVSELNGDTITDFSIGDRIVVTGASLPGFTFNLSGSNLSFSGGSMTLTGGISGQLVASAVTGGVALTIQASAGAAGHVQNDFNGDGRSDILWRETNGAITTWLGEGDGGFFNNDANTLRWVPQNWQIEQTGDFNGDGRADILWRETNGAITTWLGRTDGGFVNNDANALQWVPQNWQVAQTGDFNGDGRGDILWRENNGAITTWLGRADGGFLNNDANALRWVPQNWQIAETGDFNGDGRGDILWRETNGAITTWLGRADGGFINNDANALQWVPRNWQIEQTGDFNGDGRGDILWRETNGAITTWLGRADGGFINNDANALQFMPLNWQIMQTGDFNGDGRSDILWRENNGAITTWLGEADGGFFNNDANALQWVPQNWQVQNDYLL